MTHHFSLRLAAFLLATSLCSGIPFGLSNKTHAASKEVAKGKKIRRVVGDPARKRGIELGFDKGYELGIKDKKENKTSDPKKHPDFNSPAKYYRGEYGSQAGFESGFKGGFIAGYHRAFGRKIKVNIKGVYQKPKRPGEETTSGGGGTRVDPASDAL